MTPRDDLALRIFLARGCTPAEAFAAADAWLAALPTLHQHEWRDAGIPGVQRMVCVCGAVQGVANAP